MASRSMVKVDKVYSRMMELMDILQTLADTCEERYTGIEEKRMDHDRDMTETEEERYEALETEQQDIEEAMNALAEAMYAIEEYLTE